MKRASNANVSSGAKRSNVRLKCMAGRYKCLAACVQVFLATILSINQHRFSRNEWIKRFGLVMFQVPRARRDTIVERGGTRLKDLVGRMGRHSEELHRDSRQLPIAVGWRDAPSVTSLRGRQPLLREC